LLAVIASGLVLATSCTSKLFTPTTISKPIDLYAATPSQGDASSLLGGGQWWTAAPTFDLVPLNLATASSTVKFSIVRRYVNIGTSETWRLRYSQLDKAASATKVMTDIQNTNGTGAGGSGVGDQSLNYGLQQSSGAAPYEVISLIRVGSILVEATWNRKDGFPTAKQLTAVGRKLVSKIRDAVAGKTHGTPPPAQDLAHLPPRGPDLTMLGAVKLPIEALPLMLNSSAPVDTVAPFKDRQVTDFVYGDYALDKDTHMEVQVGLFSFSSASDAGAIFTAIAGGAQPDANGILRAYDDTSGPGQYEYFFTSATYIGMMICRSTSDLEAASRSCEKPLESVGAAWSASLGH
jgi:hypothetical protein